jgi:hypothetical protein
MNAGSDNTKTGLSVLEQQRQFVSLIGGMPASCAVFKALNFPSLPALSQLAGQVNDKAVRGGTGQAGTVFPKSTG